MTNLLAAINTYNPESEIVNSYLYKKMLPQAIELMKREILEDVATGRVKLPITCYGDLHDHVDANCYGGFCDDSTPQLDYVFGTWDESINYEGSQARMQFFNDCQDACNQWIINAPELFTDTSPAQPLYKITWVYGYGMHDGSSATHPREFYSDENGIDEGNQEKLDALEIGESFEAGGITDKVTIQRIQ